MPIVDDHSDADQRRRRTDAPTEAQRRLRARNRRVDDARRADLAAAHEEIFAEELAAAADLAAAMNPDLPRPDWTDPAVLDPTGLGALFDGPPVPFRARTTIPEFPTNAFPDFVEAMVEAVSEDTQTDPAMAGAVALGVLASAAAGFVDVEVRRGWREPATLFVVPVAGPAQRKSAVLSAFTAPLHEVERQLNEARKGDRARIQADKVVAEAAASKAAAIASTAVAADDPSKTVALTEAEAAANAAAAIEVPPAVRLVADDITPEAAGSMLIEQGGRLAIVSAEGGIFDTFAGRYSKGIPNIDLALKGHAGDPFKMDRRDRSEATQRAVLALLLMVQPTVIDALARNDAFRGRGFLARLLFSLPESRVGRRNIDSAPVPDHVRAEWDRRIGELLTALASRDRDQGPIVLTLDEGAWQGIRALLGEVEGSLLDGDLAEIQEWGGKYVGTVARIAGLLHLSEFGVSGEHLPISAAMVSNAIMVGEYFRSCARETFGNMGADPASADAEYVLDAAEKLAAKGKHPFVRRELQLATKGRMKAAELDRTIALLIDHGWMAIAAHHPPGPLGGRSTVDYALNPHRPHRP